MEQLVEFGQDNIVKNCNDTIKGDFNENFFISNTPEWRQVFTEDYSKQNYIPYRIKKKIFNRTLTLRDPMSIRSKSEDSRLFRESRFLTDEFKFIHTIGLTKEGMYIYECRKPYRTIVLRNKNLSSIFQTVFENMWRLSARS